MRYVGRIAEWDDDRGFGFVTPNGGGDRAFVHIKAFERASSRPAAGMLISYELLKDDKGRFNAKGVRFVARKPKSVALVACHWQSRCLQSSYSWLVAWLRIPGGSHAPFPPLRALD
jgi:cold shock CspA family protein